MTTPSKEERIRRLATGALAKCRTYYGPDGLHIEYNEMENALEAILGVLNERPQPWRDGDCRDPNCRGVCGRGYRP